MTSPSTAFFFLTVLIAAFTLNVGASATEEAWSLTTAGRRANIDGLGNESAHANDEQGGGSSRRIRTRERARNLESTSKKSKAPKSSSKSPKKSKAPKGSKSPKGKGSLKSKSPKPSNGKGSNGKGSKPTTAAPTPFPLGRKCRSPFGIHPLERERIVDCYGRRSPTVNMYDSDVYFVEKVLEMLRVLTNGTSQIDFVSDRQKFGFFPNTVGQSQKCPSGAMKDLVFCATTRPATIGDFIESLAANPKKFPQSELVQHCDSCGDAYRGNCTETIQGGGGSGAGISLYCTVGKGKKAVSIPILSTGGGGGGGGQPGGKNGLYLMVRSADE